MDHHELERHPRVIELQERVAFLERDVETLDGVVRELAGRLDVTVRELTRLREDTAGRFEEVGRVVAESASGQAGEAEPAGGAGPGGAGSGPAAGDADFSRDLPPHWGRASGRSRE
ncbi:MAG: hypothetical protein ACYTEV_11905 [Planctomycetota bacterium]|jgi:uncharacterized coiled-coil protein SlyX